MYIQYFGLKENPFALPPDPRYLYLSELHKEALAHLLYGITEGGGFVQLIGEVGTGKTMMIRALLERLPDTVDVALVLYPFLSVQEFMAAICDDLRVPRPADRRSLKSLIDALNGFLLENHAKGRRTVLIVDEAHKLSREVLEQIRLLTNLETTKEKLLQIVLVGQPELAHLLAQQDLRQLAQRITARYSLKPLLPRETGAYVLHRCRVAGAQATLFSRAALRWVHRLSGGVPRLINVICDRALLGAYARGRTFVNASTLRYAADEAGVGTRRLFSWRLALAAPVAALGVAALAVWQWPALAPTFTPVGETATVATAAAPGGDETGSVAVTAAAGDMPASSVMRLEALLADPAVTTDTETAFAALFRHWQLNFDALPGGTGCERAERAGLRCVLETGTWNNLRQLNRPAIIELFDDRGGRHHVLVSGLTENTVTLELAGERHEFPFAEVGRFWFGKFLALWSVPPAGERTLRRGVRDPTVVWVREALARYGLPPAARHSELFDAELEEQIKEFQRRHRLDDDGVVGRQTLIQLSTYDARVPPLLTAATSVSR